ncbi:hypothetical protein KXV85_000328, partial [Aspergillus fumigatus]
ADDHGHGDLRGPGRLRQGLYRSCLTTRPRPGAAAAGPVEVQSRPLRISDERATMRQISAPVVMTARNILKNRSKARARAAARAIAFLRHKQVLHKLGLVVSIAVIGTACYVLYHMLRGIDVNEVLEAIKSTEPRQIAMAALFVAAGYFTLTFYDLFAVRAIGHTHVPYRVNALAAFTSYSIGHNVGASVFTGGAVRYRIYSAYGLNAIDVAKICFLAGLTFWLGNAAVLGLGISYHPEAAATIDQLPVWLNRTLALMIL